MPDITITVSDDDYRTLSDEYKKASIAWLRLHPTTVQLSFEQWLSEHVVEYTRQTAMSSRGVENLHAITAMEKLITRLQSHGFGLAYLGKPGTEPAESIFELARAVASELGLPHHIERRLHELLEYYTKNAKEIADTAHVVMTNRAYGALHEALRELGERTAKAAAHLGDERAIGRIEGAVAILAGVRVMTREAAQEKAEAFKQTLRKAKE